MPIRHSSQGVLQQVELNSAREFLSTEHQIERAPETILANSRDSQLLELTCVHTDTYSAICTFIRSSEALQSNVENISDKDLDDLLAWLDAINCDISSHQGFPSSKSGGEELETAISLLARLQNRLVLMGEKIQDTPMLEDITQSCLTSRKGKALRYNLGEWVEIRGVNMEWGLARIVDTIKQKVKSEETLFYFTSNDNKLTEADVRLPKEALLAVFGVNPWIWQQWACLRLENMLRFEDGHRNDFEIFNIQGYAEELWELWLQEPKNQNFQNLFSRAGEFGQEELMKHIMDPFILMQDVVSNDTGKWETPGTGLSVYTYLSVLGSGFTDAFLLFCLQVAMPSVLYISYVSVATNDTEDGSLTLGTRSMLFLTLGYYLFKITRDLHSNFRRLVCGTDSVHSRILSLRSHIWAAGNDNFPQSIGYVLDLFMNTGYLCILYIYNMFILFNSRDAFDILSSVVIFQLLFNLDEEIAASEWWDKDGRWMKAGIIEMILQISIRREFTHSWDLYHGQFARSLTPAERQELQKRFHAAAFTDNTFLVGSENYETITLLTVRERIEQKRWQEAAKRGIVKIPELEKQDVYFGGLMKYGISAVFQKHEKYRAWSQWEQLLFLFPVPSLVSEEYIPGTRLELNTALSGRRIEAIVNEKTERSEDQQFWSRIWDVLTLRVTKREVNMAKTYDVSRRRTVVATRSFYGVFAWTSFLMQLLFPAITLLAVVAVWTSAYCTFQIGLLSDDICKESKF